jgi:lipopolysaccharide/colanic/teichoic acid biosynthesis glycosyltransferase
VHNARDLRNDDGTTLASSRDPRVTPLGRWLRRTSLDELPQLWNVIGGSMSLVGPRPDLPDHLEAYLPEHRLRLSVRPGITGWAAVHGRNERTLLERRSLDVWYARHFSLALDIRILCMTVAAVFSGRGVNKPIAADDL